MRALFITLPAALALAACVEVDMSVDVLGEDEARLTGFMQMERQMFEMSGGDATFCNPDDGGTFVLTETHARCEFDQTGTFAEIMQSDSESDAPTDLQGELTYLGENRVRAFLPLSSMTNDMAEIEDDPQMLAMMRQMFAGMSITFTIQGREIESSTATISEDGTRATVVMGVEDLIAPTTQRMTDFETIVKF